MRIAVVGVGAVGARAARQLVPADDVESLALVDPDRRRAATVADSLGEPALVASAIGDVDVVVLAHPGDHRAAAEAVLERGASVVSVSDDTAAVRSLLDLDAEARERGRTVVVGAGLAPGLTCLLARHAAAELDQVDEIHVAKTGTAGPACARRHHQALSERAVDWRDGTWVGRRGGSGRELCWFPDPIGPQDCYRAGLPDALLLAPAFPGVERVTARVAATRRDRLTAHLPMLRPPHPEGLLGAVRVEVRGHRDGSRETKVLGALDRPGVAAGAVAAVVALLVGRGEIARPGAAGLATVLADPLPALRELARRGVTAAAFEGSSV